MSKREIVFSRGHIIIDFNVDIEFMNTSRDAEKLILNFDMVQVGKGRIVTPPTRYR